MNGTPPPVDRILETCIHAEDLNKSADFYERLFGFHRMLSTDRLCVFDVASQSVLIVFQRGSTSEPAAIAGGVIPPHGGSGHLHFAFAIAKEDLAAWEQRLRDAHVAVESRVHWESGGDSLYFRDPDNHLVELATPGIWPSY
jgi:catechol 2,3-dioxygenase-like lactoylglutathione lyase family enzyme